MNAEEWKRKSEEIAAAAEDARRKRLARTEVARLRQAKARTPAQQPQRTFTAEQAAEIREYVEDAADVIGEETHKMVRELRQEIAQLRSEIAELREQKVVRLGRGGRDAAA